MSSVFSQPAPQRRPALTREAIVAAAIEVADAEGLAAVSIRRVAAELGARAMSLYSHIARKEDLLALMLDQIALEVLADEPPPDDWREAILATARRERALVRRHPWRVELMSQRVAVGPNGLRHVEEKLAALDGLGLDRPATWRVLAAVNDYVTGFVVREAQERILPRRDGITDDERAALAEPYIRELVTNGEFPHLAPMIEEGVGGAADTFEQGLGWLLAGIAAEGAHLRR